MEQYQNELCSDPQTNLNIQKEAESTKDKLYKIKDLYDKGILTQEEFDSMKKEIIKKGI